MSRAALTLTQTFLSVFYCFFFPCWDKTLPTPCNGSQHESSSPQQCPGAVWGCSGWEQWTQQRPEGCGSPQPTHWERNWWCLQDLCHLGVTWARWTQKEWQERWIRSCAASVCSLSRRALSVCWSVPSHQGPILRGTGWVPRREPHPKPATAPGKGYVWIVGVFEVTYEEKREKKTYTKNPTKGCAIPVFPSGNTFLSSC